MTNERAKQEAIKKAYGELYERFNTLQVIDENGYVTYGESMTDIAVHPFELGFNPETEIQWNGTRWRPINLIGLHHNNGWIRIEPDGSNLPETKPTKYKVYYDGSLPNLREPHKNNDDLFTCISVRLLYSKRLITHYKPITPELKPIY